MKIHKSIAHYGAQAKKESVSIHSYFRGRSKLAPKHPFGALWRRGLLYGHALLRNDDGEAIKHALGAPRRCWLLRKDDGAEHALGSGFCGNSLKKRAIESILSQKKIFKCEVVKREMAAKETVIKYLLPPSPSQESLHLIEEYEFFKIKVRHATYEELRDQAVLHCPAGFRCRRPLALHHELVWERGERDELYRPIFEVSEFFGLGRQALTVGGRRTMRTSIGGRWRASA